MHLYKMIQDIPKERILVYDTETTGLYPGRDEILQFSACDGTGHVLLNTYIRPKKMKEWPDAAAVNGITPDMVQNSPTMDEIRDRIQNLFDHAYLLVAYNAHFDNAFLREAGIRHRKGSKSFDVMKVFAEVYGEWNDYFSDYKWQKLTTAASYYDFNWGSCKAHDSMGDVFATLHVFNCLLGEMRSKEERT